MSKVLISVHMGRHFTKFGQSDLETLLEMGHEVHIAANFRGSLDHYNDDRVVKHQIDFSRNPFSFNNIRAFIQMKSILMRENFSLVHTQSPSGGAITRLALNSCKDIINTKVIYTAHGFHFYKGASWIAWNLFFPIEKHLSKNTDLCITINEEDYALARTKMFFNKVVKVNGVGIDTHKIMFNKPKDDIILEKLRNEFSIKSEDYVMIYVAELSRRKNQIFLINQIKKMNISKRIKLLLVGTGNKENEYRKLINKEHLSDRVLLLGQRNDISNLLTIADLYVSSSKQEGLPLSVMEAMSMGLPLLLSNVRGNSDLVSEGENGYSFYLDKKNDFETKLNILMESGKHAYGKKSRDLSSKYHESVIRESMKAIYSELTN